jgi:hypothetical protein
MLIPGMMSGVLLTSIVSSNLVVKMDPSSQRWVTILFLIGMGIRLISSHNGKKLDK